MSRVNDRRRADVFAEDKAEQARGDAKVCAGTTPVIRRRAADQGIKVTQAWAEHDAEPFDLMAEAAQMRLDSIAERLDLVRAAAADGVPWANEPSGVLQGLLA
jgi:hypothetical protein